VDVFGKMLVVIGLAITVFGLFLWLGPARGRSGLLPGDIFVEKGQLKLYFPIVTCLILSALLTLLLWLFRK
jgi:hypothetical protein